MNLDVPASTSVRELSCQFPGDSNLLPQVMPLCKCFLQECKNCRDASLVLRELLNNAVLHGVSGDGAGAVSVQVSVRGNYCDTVTVEDEGEGFDYTSLSRSLPEDPRKLVQRGYPIIKALSEQVSFNEQGNSVTVIFKK